MPFYQSDDTTLATALVFGPTAAGATSATQTLHFWYNKGTSLAAITNLNFQAVDPATGLADGVDWLDETWLEARVNGGANPGADAGFRSVTTDWYRIGKGTVLPAPDLPGNCAYYLELRLHPPLKEGAPAETVNFKIVANYNESALALAGALSDLGAGIVTGVGDRTVTEWVEAPTVTATGTPDALVHVSKRWYVYNGFSLRTCATGDLTLNQNDSAAVALTTGKEYKAVISQPPGAGAGDVAAVVTKGLLAVTGAGVIPAVPAGNLPIAVVNVAYHASASVISTGDIATLATDGRGRPTIGTGLNVNIAALRAVMPGARVLNRSARAVAVPASSTSYLWLSSTDGITVSATTDPPFSGALPLCKAVSGGSTVSSVTDLRTFFEPNMRLTRLKFLRAEPSLMPLIRTFRATFTVAASAFTDMALTTVSGDMLILAVSGRWLVQPGGAATADVGISGATTRYATGTSMVAASTFTGLADGVRYYSTAPTIRVTPNATPSDALGRLELTFTALSIRSSASQRLDAVQVPYAWNLDRMAARVIAAPGTATGATTFDVQTATASLCPSGFQPSIAAGSAADLTGYPNVTVGPGNWFALYLSAVTDAGTFDYAEDPEVDLYLYPVTRMA